MYSRANDQEVCGWWKALIKVIKQMCQYMSVKKSKIFHIISILYHFLSTDDQGWFPGRRIPRLGIQLHGNSTVRASENKKSKSADRRKYVSQDRNRCT